MSDVLIAEDMSQCRYFVRYDEEAHNDEGTKRNVRPFAVIMTPDGAEPTTEPELPNFHLVADNMNAKEAQGMAKRLNNS